MSVDISEHNYGPPWADEQYNYMVCDHERYLHYEPSKVELVAVGP